MGIQKENREIAWSDMIPSDLSQLSDMLTKAGWIIEEIRPFYAFPENELPIPSLDIFRKIAPHMASGHVIRESIENGRVTSWVHFVYHDGTVQETETPAHQWTVSHVS